MKGGGWASGRPGKRIVDNVPSALVARSTDLEPFRVPAYRRYLLAGTLTSVSLWTFTTSLNWTVLGDTGSAAIEAFRTAFTV